MSIFVPKTGNSLTVTSPETMYGTIEELGIVPFFENPIPGFSIEERTPREFWFDGEDGLLGPWDWKIFSVQSGDIAYGKFLWGGKAAFATVQWYAELMNYRRSLPKYAPTEEQQRVLALMEEQGSISIRDIRKLLDIKKSAADALMTRLQMQCRVVTGDISRVYLGPDLHYNGWQVSSFCSPEGLFEGALPPTIPRASRPISPTDTVSGGPSDDGLDHPFSRWSGFPFGEPRTLEVGHSPAESLERLVEHIREIAPEATEKQILKMLG